jgi:hypothetical protein
MSHHNWHDMICHNKHYVRCYNSTTYNALYHGLLQQQKLAMSHAMTQHALCHVLWHNSIQCHSILFWNKMQYVAACYSSINSMSFENIMFQRFIILSFLSYFEFSLNVFYWVILCEAENRKCAICWCYSTTMSRNPT